MVRLQKMDDVAGFQNRQPLPRRDCRYTAVRPQRRQVEQLARACRTHAHKALKQRQVTHCDELAHVALEVGAHVVGKPVTRQQLTVVQGGVGAAQQQVF